MEHSDEIRAISGGKSAQGMGGLREKEMEAHWRDAGGACQFNLQMPTSLRAVWAHVRNAKEQGLRRQFNFKIRLPPSKYLSRTSGLEWATRDLWAGSTTDTVVIKNLEKSKTFEVMRR